MSSPVIRQDFTSHAFSTQARSWQRKSAESTLEGDEAREQHQNGEEKISTARSFHGGQKHAAGQRGRGPYDGIDLVPFCWAGLSCSRHLDSCRKSLQLNLGILTMPNPRQPGNISEEQIQEHNKKRESTAEAARMVVLPRH